MNNAILSHGDLDGITSGAIGLLAYPGSDFYFSRPSMIAKDLYRIAKDRPDVVVVSDIAINNAKFTDLLRALDRFPKSSTIHWIDHHPMTSQQRKKLSQRVEMFHMIGPCAAELVYRKFEKQIPE
ncbi:MAG: hypothetical protein RTU30_12300, partial [Candidatus Thorarchaeota archaeon]